MLACNSSLDCSIIASEDFPGWKTDASVALCTDCDKLENWKENDTRSDEEAYITVSKGQPNGSPQGYF